MDNQVTGSGGVRQRERRRHGLGIFVILLVSAVFGSAAWFGGTYLQEGFNLMMDGILGTPDFRLPPPPVQAEPPPPPSFN
jgi:hypothetical protein